MRARRAITRPEPWAALAALIAAIAATWRLNGPGAWHAQFFYDEMWKADYVRTALPDIRHQMLTGDTPIPFGWVLTMKSLTWFLPSDEAYMRAVAVGWMLLGLLLLCVTLIRLGTREGRSLPGVLVGAAAVAPLVALMPIGVYVTLLNNYGFDVFYVCALLLLAEELGRTRGAFPALCVAIAAGPAFTIGGLFAFPGIGAAALWWVWHDSLQLRRTRLIALGAATGAAALVFAFFWIRLYDPMTRPQLDQFWIVRGASLGGSANVFDLLWTAVRQFRDGLVGPHAIAAGGVVLVLATIAVAASFAFGCWTLARRWPWVLVVGGSAQLFAIAGSAAVHWPMTVERVNLPFQVLWFATCVYGAAAAFALLMPRVRLPTLALVPLTALLIFAVWPPSLPAGTAVYARGLPNDLETVANTPARHNLVIQYHWMAHNYTHDQLINTTHPGHSFDIVYQDFDDRSLYQPIDGVIEHAGLHRGDMLWCVMPREIGDESIAEACRFRQPRLKRTVVLHGRRAEIRGYVLR